MSWLVVAKRTMLDPIRSRHLWATLALVGLVLGLLTHLMTGRYASEVLFTSFAPLFVLIAIARSYQTISSRRQSGSLRVVLSYPHSRRDVVLGTVLGRSVLMAGVVSFGLIVAVGVQFINTGLPDSKLVLYTWGIAVLLAVSMTGLAVGISSSARTTNRSVLLSFTAFLLFFGFWQQLPSVIRYVLNGLSKPTPPRPEWVDVFVALNPIQAYNTTLSALVPAIEWSSNVYYETAWFGVLVLLGWLLLPLLIGLWRFERSDL